MGVPNQSRKWAGGKMLKPSSLTVAVSECFAYSLTVGKKQNKNPQTFYKSAWRAQISIAKISVLLLDNLMWRVKFLHHTQGWMKFLHVVFYLTGGGCRGHLSFLTDSSFDCVIREHICGVAGVSSSPASPSLYERIPLFCLNLSHMSPSLCLCVVRYQDPALPAYCWGSPYDWSQILPAGEYLLIDRNTHHRKTCVTVAHGCPLPRKQYFCPSFTWSCCVIGMRYVCFCVWSIFGPLPYC